MIEINSWIYFVLVLSFSVLVTLGLATALRKYNKHLDVKVANKVKAERRLTDLELRVAQLGNSNTQMEVELKLLILDLKTKDS